MLSFIQRHRLSLTLSPIFIGKLTTISSLKNTAYGFEDGAFVEVLNSDQEITNQFISNYAQKIGEDIFVSHDDLKEIEMSLQEELTKNTRSLSIGDIKKNAKKQVNLLTMQMSSLYENPFNDELLLNQFQNSKNLGILLYNNKSIQKEVYENLVKQRYHYIHKQPLLASIMLLSYLQTLGFFSENEIQTLFLTSYFKDIGMSFIPAEKFETKILSEFDKDLFSEHAESSVKILERRIPLNQTQLNMIANHHFLNDKIKSMVTGEDLDLNQEFIVGVESVMMNAVDIIVAMTSERPYRDATTSYKALELIKKTLSNEYSQEFKSLVFFLKNFLSK